MNAATRQPLLEIINDDLTLRLSVERAEDPASEDWLVSALEVAASEHGLALTGRVSLSIGDIAELGAILDRLLRPDAAAVGASAEWVTSDEDVILRLSVLDDDVAIEGEFATGWGSAQVAVQLARSRVPMDKLHEMRGNVLVLSRRYSTGLG